LNSSIASFSLKQYFKYQTNWRSKEKLNSWSILFVSNFLLLAIASRYFSQPMRVSTLNVAHSDRANSFSMASAMGKLYLYYYYIKNFTCKVFQKPRFSKVASVKKFKLSFSSIKICLIELLLVEALVLLKLVILKLVFKI